MDFASSIPMFDQRQKIAIKGRVLIAKNGYSAAELQSGFAFGHDNSINLDCGAVLQFSKV